MKESGLQPLLRLVQRKSIIDQSSNWSDGSSTYLTELKKEVAEVEEEIENGDSVYLIDELSDVLWDYLNLINCLSSERNISLEEVIARANKKYDERISGIEAGRTWQEIKSAQKTRLAERAEITRSDI